MPLLLAPDLWYPPQALKLTVVSAGALMLRIYTPITLKDQTTEVYSQAKRERITAASLRILRRNLKGRPLRKELLTATPAPRPLGTMSFKTTKYTGRQRLSRAIIF